MHDTLSRRAEELAHLTDLIRTSLSLADSAIGPINEQLAELAEMGIDNIEIEGPAIYSRAAGWSPAFDENRILYAAALIMPGGVGCTAWAVDVGKGDAAGGKEPTVKRSCVPFSAPWTSGKTPTINTLDRDVGPEIRSFPICSHS